MAGNRFRILSKGHRSERGKMNKTETRYSELLKAQKLAGEIADYWFEPLSLRLSRPAKGQPARYSPDFLILMPDGTTIFDDVKGTGIDNEASIVRIKVAAELYPLWVFRIAKERRKRDGGGWDVKTV